MIIIKKHIWIKRRNSFILKMPIYLNLTFSNTSSEANELIDLTKAS